jgi:hypothetical protein
MARQGDNREANIEKNQLSFRHFDTIKFRSAKLTDIFSGQKHQPTTFSLCSLREGSERGRRRQASRTMRSLSSPEETNVFSHRVVSPSRTPFRRPTFLVVRAAAVRIGLPVTSSCSTVQMEALSKQIPAFLLVFFLTDLTLGVSFLQNLKG